MNRKVDVGAVARLVIEKDPLLAEERYYLEKLRRIKSYHLEHGNVNSRIREWMEHQRRIGYTEDEIWSELIALGMP